MCRRPAAVPRSKSSERHVPKGQQQQPQQQQQQQPSVQAVSLAQPLWLPPASAEQGPRRVVPQPVVAAHPTGPAAAPVQTPAAPHAGSVTAVCLDAADAALDSAKGLAAAATPASAGHAAAGRAGEQAAATTAVTLADNVQLPLDESAAAGATPSSAAKRMRRIQPVPVSGPPGGSNLPLAVVRITSLFVS